MVTQVLDEEMAIAILVPFIESAAEATEDAAERTDIAYRAVCAYLNKVGANMDWVERKWQSLSRSTDEVATALVELMVQATNREEIEVPTHRIVTTVEKLAYF